MENIDRRIARIADHIATPDNALVRLCDTASQNPDDDVVIVSALRTPICKAGRGAFKDTHPVELLSSVLKATVERTKVDPKSIGDVVVGWVLAPGGGAMAARMASFVAGLPEDVPLATTNRQCSSGLQAFATVAAGIRNGYYDMAIAAGVESMSKNDMTASVGELYDKAQDFPKAMECLIPMGITSENVAERFGVTREQQDKLAADSHKKAAAAQKAGKFDAEIVPVTVTVKKGDQETKVTVSKDEGVRAETTPEGLAKLKAAFKQGGTTTAGNSSQVSDGAAAVLAAKRSVAKKLGLPILGTFRSFAVVGVPPDIMGVGPAFAIPEALKKAGITVNDVDVFEINEAFASQALYSVNKLGIPLEKVNPNGGAIALGHPLGCTGARQIATLLNELKRRRARYGVVSMCIGTGMGAAAVFEAEL